MKSKFLRLGIVCGLTLISTLMLAAGGQSASAAGVGETSHSAFKTLPFLTLGIGERSGCVRPAKMVITDDAQWRRVWRVHTHGILNSPALPIVDFSRQVVLVLLNGVTSSPKVSIEVAQVVSGPQETLVYYYADGTRTAKPLGTRVASKAQPFHFAVIDKPATPIRFVNAIGATCSDCGK